MQVLSLNQTMEKGEGEFEFSISARKVGREHIYVCVCFPVYKRDCIEDIFRHS